MIFVSFSRSHRHFEIQIWLKQVCVHTILNHLLELYQTSADTPLGHGKDFGDLDLIFKVTKV